MRSAILGAMELMSNPFKKGSQRPRKAADKTTEVSRFVRITILLHEPLITEPLFKAFYGHINYVLSDKR